MHASACTYTCLYVGTNGCMCGFLVECVHDVCIFMCEATEKTEGTV